MENHLKEESTTSRRFSGLTMLSSFAGLAGIIALLVLSLTNEYQDANHHARVEVENITRVLEEHALATMHTADLLLHAVQRNVRPDDLRPARGVSRSRVQELHELLKSPLENVPEVAVIHVTNAMGNHIYSSLDPVPKINIADRYHFLRHKDDAAAGLVISPPIVSRTTGKWTIVLSRRLNFEDGSFAGISNVILNLEYFQQFYRTLDLGKQGLVALYDKELHLAARHPPSEKDMGKISGIHAKTYIEQGIKHATYRAKSPLDGIRRQIGYRQVGDLPLFVFAGIAEDEYLAEWYRHIWQYSIAAIIFGLVIVGFGLRQRRAEKELSQDEVRFRYMLETSPIAVRIASASGRKVLFANQRYAELIESQPDGVIGVDPKAYYSNPQDYEDILQHLSRGESVTNRLVELLIPGGKSKWTLASYLNLEYGNEAAVLGWFYDITERKKTETALRDSESRLTAAQHIARIGNWELDLVNNRLWWSEEIFRIFEIESNRFDASYEAFLAAIHPDDRDAVNRSYSDSLANQVPYEIEHRLLLQGGRIKYVHEHGETEFDPSGKPLRSFGTVQDITQRKLAEMALQRSEATSRALINATTESAMLLDENGTLIAINEVGAHRLRRGADEIIGTNFYDLLPPDLAKSRRACARQVFQSGTAAHLQDVRDGVHFDTNVYPVFDADGKVANLAVYAADVTEQLQSQEIDKLFHGIDQQVLRGQPIDEIFGFICSEVTRIFDFQYAWIGRREEGGAVSISAGAGPAVSYRDELERVGVRWDDTPQGRGPTGATIRTGQVQIFKLSDAGFQPWHEAAKRHEINAILGLPLIIRGQVYGAFTLYSRQEHSFDLPDLLQRLSAISSRLCVALETATDQQQLMLLSTALSATANGVFISDRAGRIQWVNKAFTALTGYGEMEAIGSTPRLLRSGKQDPLFYKKLWQTILRGEVWRDEMEDRRKDGSEFYMRQTITPILDGKGEISHFIAILEDISVEKDAEARIEFMAHHDSLTKLPNRALFLDRLNQALVSARRANHPVALMFLDLDHFKSVNDTLGHHAGDLLLQQVAARLRACVRESDTVARLAGDEFTLILPEIAVKEDAARVAEKVIAAFAPPFDLEGHEVSSGASIGIALFPADANDEEGMLKRADAAMYAAKEDGRNRFAFFAQK